MNAAAKALALAHPSTESISLFFTDVKNIVVLLLGTLVLCSAFGVVYVKDLNRRLTSQLQSMQQTQQHQRIERDKLLLERSTLAAPARVQNIAQNQLNMQIPSINKVVIVQLR